MSRKATILMRVLAVTSAFEAAGGLALLIPTFIKLRSPQGEGVPGSPPPPAWVLEFMTAANVAFAAMLILCATLLWKLKPTGLRLLIGTFCLELFYYLCLAAALLWLGFAQGGSQRPFALQIASMIGVGNLVVGIQISTAYPLVAGILIFYCYRSLRIQATS